LVNILGKDIGDKSYAAPFLWATVYRGPRAETECLQRSAPPSSSQAASTLVSARCDSRSRCIYCS